MQKNLSHNLPAQKSVALSTPTSKYEMNLAEFPITLLSKRLQPDLKVIEYHDEIRGKDGAIVPRTWRVFPSSLYGFGSTQLNATLFALFQVWREQGFASPIIQFGSMYNLIKRLGLKDEPTAYQRIRRDLNALVGITIEARNAFWDNELKAYADATFHLFDSVIFYHDGKRAQQALPLAHLTVNEKLWGSIQANALTTLSIDPAQFSAFTPVEQRLALYLSKMLYSHREHRRDVSTLALQIPIYAKRYKDTKKMLTRASDGLLAKGFPHLSSYRYEPKQKRQGDNIIFARDARSTPSELPAPRQRARPSNDERDRKELLIQDLIAFSGHEQSRGFYARAVYALESDTIYRAISETKYEHLEGRIQQSKAQVLNSILQRLAHEQGISLT